MLTSLWVGYVAFFLSKKAELKIHHLYLIFPDSFSNYYWMHSSPNLTTQITQVEEAHFVLTSRNHNLINNKEHL